MRKIFRFILFVLGCLCFIPAFAQADERIHLGVLGSVAFPTGDFAGTTSDRRDYYYDQDYRVPGFSSAFGGHAFIGLPVLPRVTIRPNVSYYRFKGDKGDYNWGNNGVPTQMTLDLAAAGVDVQFFFSQHSRRYRSYVFIGTEADTEKLYVGGQSYTSDFAKEYDVKRSALTFGYGGILRGQDVSTVFEFGYHRTTSGDMPSGLNFPESNYWRISIGAIF